MIPHIRIEIYNDMRYVICISQAVFTAFLIIYKIALKIKCLVLHSVSLDIPICGGYVAVTCLVTGNDNTMRICQVSYARILQTVELIAFVPL